MKKTFFQKVHDLILSALGGLIVLFLSFSILGMVIWFFVEEVLSGGETSRTLIICGCLGILPFGIVAVFAIRNIRKSWRNLDRMETFISSLSEEERRELLDMMSSSEDVSIGVDAEGCRHFVSED